MSEADQTIRKKLIQDAAAQLDNTLIKQLSELDRSNTDRLKRIIQEFGWPGPALVGKDGTQAAFLILQHATHDRPFQKAMLPVLEREFEAGRLAGESLALLTDRVLVGENKPQRYGTQAKITDGRLVFDPIENETQLDQRRTKLGMIRWQDYKKVLDETYGLSN